ncbi:MAG: hypothetical protein C3F12_12300 [Candidatus Methylomirabilota bacterium]|nr:MAG: hypothetical protein C3F12_12300 [candidate division NC10 bacterium]
MQVKADLYTDIRQLRFPSGCVDEIRLHHVFEHFNRVTALAMLIRWHDWLKVGGVLRIETPDLMGSARTLVSDAAWHIKMAAVRHLVGDQAAAWAYHLDCWFPDRFERTLKLLGFGEIKTSSSVWGHQPYLANVEAVALKSECRPLEVQLHIAEELLLESTVSLAERPTFEVWKAQLRAALSGTFPAVPSITQTPISDPLTLALALLACEGSSLPLDEIHDFNQRARDRWIAAKARAVPAGARVLDLGAGTCPYRPLFAHCDYKTHDFKKYIGDEKLGGAKDYGHIDYVSDITAIPVPDQSFDVIVCTEVLEHVSRPIEVIREISRILRPRGRAFITAPLGSGLHQLPYHFYGGFTPEWYRHFCPQCGLEVGEVVSNGGFFKLLAQECARVAGTWPQHQHLHGSEGDALRHLFSELLPRYLFALDDKCFMDKFTVGYHVEAVKMDQDRSSGVTQTALSTTVRPQADNAKTVGVAFSKDRAFQLDGTLRSFLLHCQDRDEITLKVIYRASDETHQFQYQQLAADYPFVEFLPERTFKADLLSSISGAQYVLFMVDDNIFVSDFWLNEVTEQLKAHSEALGFSLRLGKNTTYCYPLNMAQRLPEFQVIARAILIYDWTVADHDFGYPLEVSSSVYRTREMLPLLEALDFTNPNTLEAQLAACASSFRADHSRLLCYEQSITFCVPINIVQTVCRNRAGSKPEHSPEQLARLFDEGYRLKVDAYSGFTSHGCHQEIELTAQQTEATSPLVSVVIPCYNQAQYLPEAVESVVAQTFRHWECVIVNDGSPDQTSQISQELIARYADKRIRLIEKANGGLADARNAGINASIGTYILPLDADDRLAPVMLEKTVALLENQPQAGVAFTYIQHFGDQTDVWRTGPFTLETELRDNRIPYCSLYRRELFEAVGGYNTNLNAYEDWDFWLGALERGWTGALIPEPLFLYRKRANSMLAEANARREQLCVQIRANHPRLFSKKPDHPLHILIVCTHFPPSVGGLETIAAQLGKALIAKGYEVHVATERSDKRDFTDYYGMTIHSLDPVPVTGQRLPHAALQLRELILSGRYDACILLADPRNWVFWSLEGLEIPEHTRIIAQPLINADGFARWCNNRDFRARLTQILKRVHAVVTISTGGAVVQYLTEEGIPFVYIQNAVERNTGSDGFRARYGIPESTPLLLHIANLWPVKNHLGLMDALSKMDGDWRLVMIGHSSGDIQYDRQVHEAVRRDPRFMLIPGLSCGDIAAALDAADVLLLASRGEVAPVTILEAMSHAKPWLATPECGGVHDNAGGLVVPLEEFSHVLPRLLKNPYVLQRLARLGYEHWSECFRWDVIISAWDSLIQAGTSSTEFTMPPRISEEMHSIRADVLQSSRVDITPTTPVSISHSPLVSVIVPTCNRPETLRTTLDSITGQTYPNIEIIIVNDGDADLQEVVNTYRQQRPVTYVVHDRNRGTGAARNTGLKLARGEYIAYLDDDDRYLPDHIAVLTTALNAHPDHVAAYALATEVTQIERNGQRESLRRQVTYNRPFNPHQMLVANYIPNLCLMHRRSACEKIGGHDEELTMLEDWDFLIKLSRISDFVHVPQVTAEYCVAVGSGHRNRLDEHAITATRTIYERYAVHAAPTVREAQQAYLDRLGTVIRHQNRAAQPSVPPTEVADLTRQAEQHIAEGDLPAAQRCLNEALQLLPNEPQLITALGNVLLRLGDIEAARREFTKATVLHPEYAPAHTDLAAVLLFQGHAREAETAARQALRLQPTNLDALKVLARLCLGTERYAEAVQAYATILRENPEDVETLLLVGNCYAEAGRPEDAEAFYRRVLALDPGNTVAKDNLMLLEDNQPVLDGRKPYAVTSEFPLPPPASRLPSIIIVAYNSARTIRACLDSVFGSTDTPIETIVVDNASTDKTRSILREYQGRITTILNQANVGFSAACNQGIRASAGEYIVLLNPDTVVAPGWLNRLIGHSGPGVGAVGPVSDYAAELQNIDRHLPDGAPKRMALSEVSDLLARVNAGKGIETKLLTGFCLMVPRRVLDEIGLLDEALFVGNDDLDLSWRLRLKGYKLLVATDTFIHHEGQVSFKSETETKTSQLVQESTDRLYAKLEAHYGVGSVPSPMELWGITWFKPTKAREAPLAPDASPLTPHASRLTSIIILTHNGLEHTTKCLASIEACTPEPHELIIVDNASTDGTLDYLRGYMAAHDNVRAIANRTNRGFAAGNNQGLALAGGEYVLLLNNDTIVTAGWLTRMLRIFRTHPDVGIVGPVSNYVSGPQLVRDASYTNPKEFDAFAAQWATDHAGQSREATRVVGFCLLMSTEVVARIGGLDERFGSGNFEDDDLCIRAFQVGFRARIALDVFIHHAGSQTFKAAKIDYRQSLMRNWKLFKRKWGIPADSPYEKGYRFPPPSISGVPLSVPLPDVGVDHRCEVDGRWWQEPVSPVGRRQHGDPVVRRPGARVGMVEAPAGRM